MEANTTYPELLADLADQVALKLTEAGIKRAVAADIGFAAAEHIREHWSGAPIYIPKGAAYGFTQRDLELYERFNGCNHRQLAREYNLSIMRIYQIVKRVRAEHVKKCQGALF